MYIIIYFYLCLIIVPGDNTEGKRQKRLVPCVSGHSHAQSEHSGQGLGLGAPQLPSRKVSECIGLFSGVSESTVATIYFALFYFA